MGRPVAVRALAAAIVVVSVACGGFGENEEQPPVVDAGSDSSTEREASSSDASDVDVGVDASACDRDAPFGPPTELDIVGEATSFVPTLTPEETTIYFDPSSVPNAGPGAKIWRAQRARIDTPFGPPRRSRRSTSGIRGAFPSPVMGSRSRTSRTTRCPVCSSRRAPPRPWSSRRRSSPRFAACRRPHSSAP